ncbi:MAG TPA: septum site-determining protein MinC [Alcanivoracaceae bacterium]|nr:septum site-determining protein MinC [Alcanivoracaceae bacterium]
MSVEQPDTTVVQFKGRMLMVTVLQVKQQSLDLVNKALLEQLDNAQSWLSEVALVLDFMPNADEIFIHEVVSMVRLHGLNLIAVSAASQVPEEVLIPLELGVVMLSGSRSAQKETKEEQQPVPQAVETVLVEQPVRSGQQIYSRGDLIVMNSVSTGAELMAEGHIHVYGNLRGRAMAGVRGKSDAKIFCQQLNAELVSIAGHYRVADDLPSALQGKAVHISLSGEAMDIELL